MDLCEANVHNSLRHPWELARIAALQKIIACTPCFSQVKVLDIGCGDGFTVDKLFSGREVACIDAVDLQLSTSRIKELANLLPHIRFHNSYDSIHQTGYDVLTLLDVLEHVQDDSAFLGKLVQSYTVQSSYLCITVPAFQQLYGSHDTHLNHYRRYNLNQLSQLASDSGLQIIKSGYFFSLLLLPRALGILGDKFFPHYANKQGGIGNWRYGPMLTGFVKKILQIDNHLSLSLNRAGIKVPGLTAWVLCKK